MSHRVLRVAETIGGQTEASAGYPRFACRLAPEEREKK
jgi:hypothetical protein